MSDVLNAAQIVANSISAGSSMRIVGKPVTIAQIACAVTEGLLSHMECRVMDDEDIAVRVWNMAYAIAAEGNKRGQSIY